jgi:hypothetical protein
MLSRMLPRHTASLVVSQAQVHLSKETTRVGCYESTLACKGEDVAIGRKVKTLRRVDMWYSAMDALTDRSRLQQTQEWQEVCKLTVRFV